MSKMILGFLMMAVGVVSQAQIYNPDNPNHFQTPIYTPEQVRAVKTLPDNVDTTGSKNFFVFRVSSDYDVFNPVKHCFALDAHENFYKINDPNFKCESNTQPRKEVLEKISNPDLGNDKFFYQIVLNAKKQGYTILDCGIEPVKSGSGKVDRCYGAKVEKEGSKDYVRYGHGGWNEFNKADDSFTKSDGRILATHREPLYQTTPQQTPAPKVTNKSTDKIDTTPLAKMDEIKAPVQTPMVELPPDFGKIKDVAPTKPQLKNCRKVRKNAGHFVFHEDKNLYQDSNKAGNCPEETLSDDYQKRCLYKDYCQFENKECTPDRCVNYVRELRDEKIGYYNNVKEALETLYKAQNAYSKTNKKFLDCSAAETNSMYKKLSEAETKLKNAKAAYATALKTYNDEVKAKLAKGGFECVSRNTKDYYVALQYTQEANSYVSSCFQSNPALKEKYLNKIGTIRSIDSVKEKH